MVNNQLISNEKVAVGCCAKRLIPHQFEKMYKFSHKENKFGGSSSHPFVDPDFREPSTISDIKVGVSLSQKNLFYWLQGKPFINDEKCFLFHLKSSFRPQDI